MTDALAEATADAATPASASGPKAESRFKLYTVGELRALPPPSWLVAGVLPAGALAVLYGEANVGKSFVALGMGLAVASGRSWLGHRVVQGDVLYVSAEGAGGLGQRIAAWQGGKNPQADLRRFRVLPEPVDMLSDGDVPTLLQSIADASLRPRLIVLDTLARCFGAGDENATRDMNRFVRSCGDVRAAFPEATLLVIHHTGKQTARRERGSSALRGAADTLLELKRAGHALRLECDKQREWDHGSPIGLSLREVTLPDGKASCVVVASSGSPAVAGCAETASSRQSALQALGGFPNGATYTKWRDASGLPEATFKRVRKALHDQVMVEHDAKLYRLADRAQAQAHPSNEP